MQITIARPNGKYGPYTLDEVNAYLASGSLNPDDLAWWPGGTRWVPLRTVAGVQVQSQTTLLPPPPPPKSPSAQPNLKPVSVPSVPSTTIFQVLRGMGSQAYWWLAGVGVALLVFFVTQGALELLHKLMALCLVCALLGWYSPRTFGFLFGRQTARGLIAGSFAGAFVVLTVLSSTLLPAPSRTNEVVPVEVVPAPTTSNAVGTQRGQTPTEPRPTPPSHIATSQPTEPALKPVQLPLNEGLMYPFGIESPGGNIVTPPGIIGLKGPVKEVVKYKELSRFNTEHKVDDIKFYSPKGKFVRKVSFSSEGTPKSVTDYEYNQDGQMTRETTTRKDHVETITYSYVLGHLVKVVNTSDLGTVTTTYWYKNDRLVRDEVVKSRGETASSSLYSYQDGRLIRKSVDSPTGKEVYTYAYADNYLLSFDSDSTPNRPEDQVGTPRETWKYTYAKNGLIQKFVQEFIDPRRPSDQKRNLTLYNGRGYPVRFTSYDEAGKLSLEQLYHYTYDARGNWVTKISQISARIRQQNMDAPTFAEATPDTTSRKITYYSPKELNAATLADETGAVERYDQLFQSSASSSS